MARRFFSIFILLLLGLFAVTALGQNTRKSL